MSRLTWMAMAVLATACGTLAWADEQEPKAVNENSTALRIASRLGVPAASLPLLPSAPALDGAPDFTGWAGPLALVNLSGTGPNPPVETRGYLANAVFQVMGLYAPRVQPASWGCQPRRDPELR